MGRIGFPVCYALLASLVVALVYIPAGARRLKNTHASDGGRMFGALTGGYARMLAWVLEHRMIGTLLVVGFVASMVWPLGQVQRVDQLQAGLDSVRVRISAPSNATFEELNATVRQLEDRILADKDALDVRAIFARTGYSRSSGHVQLFFKPIDQRLHDRADVTARLQKLLPSRPGFRASVGWQGDGGEEGGIALSITGPDTDMATEVAEEVMAFLTKVPGVDAASLEETDNTTELRFVVDRNAAERAGVSPLDVGSTLDYTLRGRRLANFPTEMGEVEMIVGLAPADRNDADQLNLLQVQPRLANRGPDTQAIARGAIGAAAGSAIVGAEAAGGPLDLLAPTQRAPGYGEISRVNRRTQVTIRVTGDEARLFTELRDATAGLTLPPGYRIDFGTRFGRRTENEEGGAFAMVLAIILVFFLMGVLFESFLLPLSILFSVPLAFAGVAWTLYLTDTPLDVMAIVGAIILVGVVVNNGIVLIDQVQQRRAAGESRTHALVEGARQRVRPILMTAFTTIGGLIPMAVGHAALLGIEYYPLGRVVIGGMLTGTFLTLLAVPLLYSLLDDLRYLPHRVGLLLAAARRRVATKAA
jgi:HAE1 family hydrophobic/amphiphilic exporter-1